MRFISSVFSTDGSEFDIDYHRTLDGATVAAQKKANRHKLTAGVSSQSKCQDTLSDWDLSELIDTIEHQTRFDRF